MAEPMKNSFGPEVPRAIAEQLAAVSDFDVEAFVDDCLRGFDDLELMDRARRIADVMGNHMPADPHIAVPLVTDSLGPVDHGLTGMAPMRFLPLTLYVANVGLPAFEESMAAQYELTKRFTAEFSIRTFLTHEPERTLARLREWTTDPDENVRRLVSEGTRPRLPWAARLPAFIADPAPVLALLELLRDDPSQYVRRSVANNLNDVSKDHPELVVELAQRWSADGDRNRARLVRHALRTLVKRGDPQALAVLGHAPADHVEVVEVVVEPAEVAIGDRVRITVTLRDGREPGTRGAAAQEVAVDLVVHFVKANGSRSPKVFKGGRRELAPGDTATVSRTISVAQLSTRTHHPGRHRVQVQVNGRRVDGATFELVAAPGG